MDNSIADIVEKAKTGDQMALTMLYQETSSKAYYLALQLLKNEDQAQDVLQDSFIKAFQNLETLADPSKFQGWLDTIVINKSKDYLKRKKPILFSQMAPEEDPDAEPDFEDESIQFSPEATVDYNETKRLVQEMIDGLPDEQRVAIILRYLEDVPVKRIAEIMECSEGTVKSRLNYGRKAIKVKVLELEKKGTKLYCAPLVPFLLWMYRQEALAAVVPHAAMAASASTAAGTAAVSAQAASGAAASTASTGAAAATSGTTAATGTAAGTTGAATAAPTISGAESAASAAAGKTAAAAAGKTAAAAAGKALGVKVAAVIAAVAVCGAGGGYAYTKLANRPEKPVVVEREAEENSSIEIGPAETEPSDAAEVTEIENSYGLSEAELELFTGIYQAGKENDYGKIAELVRPGFEQLYTVVADAFGGKYVLFDGTGFSEDLNGYGLTFRARGRTRDSQTSHRGEFLYSLTGYIGNYEDGKPEGELLAFTLGEQSWRGRPNSGVTFSLADYHEGGSAGTVKTERLGVAEESGSRRYLAFEVGCNAEQEPEGTFNCTVYNDRDIQFYDMNRERLDSDAIQWPVSFSMEVWSEDRADEFWALTPEEQRGILCGYIYDSPDWLGDVEETEYIPDASGRYCVYRDELTDLASDSVFWNPDSSQFDEGTEQLVKTEHGWTDINRESQVWFDGVSYSYITAENDFGRTATVDTIEELPAAFYISERYDRENGWTAVERDYYKDDINVYGDNTQIWSMERATDCGEYYELLVDVMDGYPEGGEEPEEHFEATVRIRKDATVHYAGPDEDNNYAITDMTLDEYAGMMLDENGRYYDATKTFADETWVQMYNIVQDENGYIVEFSDSNAG